MASDRVVINLEDRARQVAKETSPRGDTTPSEDATALAFIERYGDEYRYVAPWHRRLNWARKRGIQDFTGSVFALIKDHGAQNVFASYASARCPIHREAFMRGRYWSDVEHGEDAERYARS